MVNAQILTLNHPQFQLAGVGEDRVLVVLDPRYGPLAFRFSPSSAKAIGEAFKLVTGYWKGLDFGGKE